MFKRLFLIMTYGPAEYLAGRRFNRNIVRCPICGHWTWDDNYICDYCDWEYDGISEGRPSCANHGLTLSQYRELYREGKLRR